MMKEVYERRSVPAAWSRPAGLSALDVDKTTGYKATPFCPKDVHYIESFIPGTEPAAFCPVHSPFGSIGVMGGESPSRSQTTRGRRLLRPWDHRLPRRVRRVAPATGGTTGVMGGTGPPPNSPR